MCCRYLPVISTLDTSGVNELENAAEINRNFNITRKDFKAFRTNFDCCSQSHFYSNK